MNEVESLKGQLAIFITDTLNAPTGRRWLRGDYVSVYVRKEFTHEKVCLSIASWNYASKYEMFFLEFIEVVHELNPYSVTLIETVGEVELGAELWKAQWKEDEQPRCFRKEKIEEELS